MEFSVGFFLLFILNVEGCTNDKMAAVDRVTLSSVLNDSSSTVDKNCLSYQEAVLESTLHQSSLCSSSNTTTGRICRFTAQYQCLMKHLGNGNIFVYFDDDEEFEYASNYNQSSERIRLFNLKRLQGSLNNKLRSYVISISQNSVEVVVSFLQENVFDLLLDIWIEESYEKVVAWLNVRDDGTTVLYAPKCENLHKPVKEMIIKTQTTINGVW